MALKRKVTYKGIESNYWKIIGLHANTLYASTVVRLALYPNQEAKEKDETSYIKVELMNIPGVDHSRENAYKEIKKKSEWLDAEDC